MFNNLLTSDFFGRIFNAPAHLVVFAVILGVVYLVLLINFILHLRKVYSKRNKAILLLGPCHSGKTVLFHHLRDGKFVETVTSMKETQEMFPLNEKYWPNTQIDATITLVDYPGHERLRSRVSDFYPLMSKIIFVVDASDQRAGTLRKAAEYLHDIFTHPKINDLAPPVLIACNKSELPNALTPQAIRTAFEKELTHLKTTRSSLETAQEEENEEEIETVPLGRDGKPFDFSIDAPCEVFFQRLILKGETAKEPIQSLVHFIQQ